VGQEQESNGVRPRPGPCLGEPGSMKMGWIGHKFSKCRCTRLLGLRIPVTSCSTLPPIQRRSFTGKSVGGQVAWTWLGKPSPILTGVWVFLVASWSTWPALVGLLRVHPSLKEKTTHTSSSSSTRGPAAVQSGEVLFGCTKSTLCQ